ncbi:MAG: NAD(P)/FAD-dependent oxidoreductase [Pseudomonadota bacterium]
MSDFDAIVVGAGNGGLTAALTLAGQGARTLLLERHNIPGGCATSFCRGRFEFEVALHQLSGMGTDAMPGPLRELFKRLGVIDRLQFVQMENLYRVVVPGALDLLLKADRAAAVTALKTQFPKEADGISRFFDLVYAFCTEMVGAFYFRDPEASREKYPTFCRYALVPAQQVLDAHFTDPLLKTAVAIYWSYMGLPPSRLTFFDLAVVLWAYIEFKPFHIKGGSQALSNALLSAFHEAGGTARFNCPVEKVVVADGRTRGVVLKGGEEVSARCVVSNAGTLATYRDLMDPGVVPEAVFRQLGAGSVGTSAITCYLGLDAQPADLGIRTATNFITTTTDMDRIYGTMKRLAAPEAMLFTCYDVDDPGFSPKGACQAALVGLQYADPWLGVPPAQYADTKYRLAEEMIRTAEAVVPGIRDAIEEMEIATPITHMRYLGHPGGAIYGTDPFAKDSRFFTNPKAPVTGLYFCGAWAGSGGFQPTLESGVSAAWAAVKALNAPGGLL